MKFNSKERNIWFASDSHYSHKNLIKSLSSWKSGAHRDFKSVDEHNQALVRNINNCAKHDDILFLLGDVAFGGYENVKKFMDQLHCQEVHLILGNHDQHIKTNRDNLQSNFTSVSTRLEVAIDDNMFVLDHYPIREWEGCHKGWYQLYGHQHNLPQTRFSNGDGRTMEVGLDGNPEFRPYSYNEILSLLQNRATVSHH